MPRHYRPQIGSRERAAIIAFQDHIGDELHRPGGARVTRKRNSTVDHRSARGRNLVWYYAGLRSLVEELKPKPSAATRPPARPCREPA